MPRKTIGQSILSFNSWIVISIFSLLVILGLKNVKTLKFNYNIESFFANKNPNVNFYEDTFKQQFGNENNYLLLGVTSESELFSYTFLSKLNKFTDSLEAVSGVKNVISPTNLTYGKKMPFIGWRKVPLLNISEDADYLAQKRYVYSLKENYLKSLFSTDTTSVQLIIEHEKKLNKNQKIALLASIRGLASNYQLNELYLSGRLRTQEYYKSTMNKEMLLFSTVALLVIFIVTWIMIRNLYFVLITLAINALSVLFSFAILTVFNRPIDLLITVIPVILIVISTSFSIHILSKIERFSKKKSYHHRGIENALNISIRPLFFNSLTTATGFFSLLFIPVKPIQYFGIIAAVGILISFVLVIILTPHLVRLIQFRKPKRTKNKTLDRSLNLLVWSNSSRRNRVLLWSMTIFIIIGVVAIFNIQTRNYFLDDLNKNSSLGKELYFFESKFNGVRPFEIIIKPDSSKYSEFQIFNDIQSLTQHLKSEFSISNVVSPLSFIKSYHKSMNMANEEFYTLPKDSVLFQTIITKIKKRRSWEKKLKIFDSETGLYRLAGRVKDLGSQYYNDLEKKLKKYDNQHLKALDIKVTGASQLMDQTSHEITKALLYGILLALFISTVSVYFLTYSIRFAIISIIPNTIPLLFAFIIMWVFEVDLKVGTSIVFTIIYGLAVDDSMHYLYNYNRYRKKGLIHQKAAQKTFQFLKKPMIRTTVILSLGFLIFSLSSFSSISFMGLAVSSSLIIALLADFYILPLILKK